MQRTHGGRIDVVLTKDKVSIACEISVTNTIDYEVQNLQKCLNEGFTHILMLSKSIAHLRNIQTKARDVLSDNDLTKIEFKHPDDFIFYLDARMPQKQSEKRVGGYRVKTDYTAGDNAKMVKDELKKLTLNKGKK